MRTDSGAPSARWLCRSIACCIPTAHASARLKLVNATMSPSPRFFTSVPPAASIAPRNRPKCVWRSSPRPQDPDVDDSSVDPTRSVNNTVTVWVVATSPSQEFAVSAQYADRSEANQLPGHTHRAEARDSLVSLSRTGAQSLAG